MFLGNKLKSLLHCGVGGCEGYEVARADAGLRLKEKTGNQALPRGEW